MKKIIFWVITLLFLSSFGLEGQTLTQKIYIDFGQNNPGEGRHTTDVDANGNYWNNMIAPNGSPSNLAKGAIVQLKSSTNQATAYELELARDIQSNGGSNGGLATPDPALLGDLAVAVATEDYFFLGNSMGKGLFKFKNLDTGKAYKFYIYGCRTASGDQRGIIYSLSGKNGSHGKQLNTGTGIGADGYNGNNNNVWVSSLVVPADNGEITLELGRLFSNQMGYMSALKMEEYSGFTLPAAEKKFYIDFGKNNNGLDGAPTTGPDVNGNYWNNMYSNGDGPSSGIVNPTFNLLSSTNETTAYEIEQTGNPQWNGVRNGALGGNDSPDEPTAALLGDLAIKTATYDYLFLDGAQTAVFNFKNLNPAKQYRFNVFGSRTDTGNEGRVGRIEITGANNSTGIHQMGGKGISADGAKDYNNKNIFVSDPIIPDITGKITFKLSTWLGFAHINLIKIEEIDGDALPEATAISISGGSAITSCGRSLQLTVNTKPQGSLCPLIEWSVDDDDLARITDAGKLYAKANGTVTVTATATLEDGTELTDSKEIIISNQDVGDYTLAIMGSSVPSGTGAASGKGYAQLYEQYLKNSAEHNWSVTNISIGGNTTTDVTNRWDNDFLPTCSRYIYYGLSLGNEGIHERGQAAFNSWRDNMLLLIERARDHGKIPFVGNNYPRGDFNATDYNFVKQLNLLTHEWDVPSVNFLGAIDNGAGQWASGYIADNAHPNTAGHAEMFYAIVPSMLDAVADEKPQPVRTENTSLSLTKNDKVQRIAFTPEGTLHSFTLSFSFKTTGTGTIASFVTATNDTLRLILGDDGKLTYKTHTSTAALNDGNWHTAGLTHYYAWGKSLLYIDGTRIPAVLINEKLVPVQFHLNDFDHAPQSVDYRELFFFRAGMCAEEMAALYAGRMLKSSLEIYAPLDGSAETEQETLKNLAQSLNEVTLAETDNIATSIASVNASTLRVYPNLVSDVLSIEGVEKDALIQLLNVQGMVVKKTEVKASGSLKIDISGLPAGIYLLKSGVDVVKVVKST